MHYCVSFINEYI